MKMSVSCFMTILALSTICFTPSHAEEKGRPWVYKCVREKDKEIATLTKLPNEGTPIRYLDSMNRGRWKLEAVDQDPTTLIVKFLRVNIDNPIVPVGLPLYECSERPGVILRIYSNAAVEETSNCVGPGCVQRWQILDFLGVNSN